MSIPEDTLRNGINAFIKMTPQDSLVTLIL